jgi:CrcB protein
MPGRDPRELLAIFAGGALGALARALLGEWLATPAGGWPWATFVVNMVAAFALGYFSTRLLERLPASNYRRPFVGTGICGGLSTFSTMQVEIVRLFEHGSWAVAIGYTLASVVGGLFLMQLASAMVRRVGVRA